MPNLNESMKTILRESSKLCARLEPELKERFDAIYGDIKDEREQYYLVLLKDSTLNDLGIDINFIPTPKPRSSHRHNSAEDTNFGRAMSEEGLGKMFGLGMGAMQTGLSTLKKVSSDMGNMMGGSSTGMGNMMGGSRMGSSSGMGSMMGSSRMGSSSGMGGSRMGSSSSSTRRPNTRKP